MLFPERVEIQPRMAERLCPIAEELGVKLQELVIHILLQYVQEWEDSELDEDEDETSESETEEEEQEGDG